MIKTPTMTAAIAVTAICIATVPAPSIADTNIAENVTLTTDTDWRAQGVVTVPEGVTVGLNGHTLWVSGLAGAGTFTSSVAPHSGGFDLTTKQTDATRVKSYTNWVEIAFNVAGASSDQPAWHAFADYPQYSIIRSISA